MISASRWCATASRPRLDIDDRLIEKLSLMAGYLIMEYQGSSRLSRNRPCSGVAGCAAASAAATWQPRIPFPARRFPFTNALKPSLPLNANIGRMPSSDCPFVSGRQSTAKGMNATQTKPKKSSVPPAPAGKSPPCSAFPHVCPEPALAKRFILAVKMAQKGIDPPEGFSVRTEDFLLQQPGGEGG